MPRNDGVRVTSSSINIRRLSPPRSLLGIPCTSHDPTSPLARTVHLLAQFVSSFKNRESEHWLGPKSPLLSSLSLSLARPRKLPPLCSASLSLSQPDGAAQPDPGYKESSASPPVESSRSEFEARKGQPVSRHDEERVLISEVLVTNKDGEELERKDLEMEALQALKACRPNSALTVREVQEDVHRIIDSGYFCSCMPVAVDTRDGIRLVFQVEPNQEFHGLVCEGANVLPSKFLEDAFRDGYGKVVNIRRLDEVINSINGWYMERGLFGLVSDVEILSGGNLKMHISEAEVNNISIRFLDRKTGEPTTGKTKPETILRQLTTKKGQVYSMLQGKRDVETVLTMGIMEDVSIIPQPVGGKLKILH